MRYIFKFLKHYTNSYLINHQIKKIPVDKYSIGLFAQTAISNEMQTNQYMYEKIMSKEPFLVGRFGGNEISMMKTIEFNIKSRFNVSFRLLCLNAGFFPEKREMGLQFLASMLEFCKACDVLGVWWQPFEGYFIQKYMKRNLYLTYLKCLEPWKCPEAPWTAALKGKKVLVIHPFSETIERQYRLREKLFPGSNILPEFELHTLKAVQTAAGEEDGRFASWFEALEWMYQEAVKIDFDIAIIGCGAYGAPLAAKIKNNGKQAIHLGGATQLLFGVKGKRWEDTLNSNYEYVQKWFNEYWVRPDQEETPKDSEKIEGSCYW